MAAFLRLHPTDNVVVAVAGLSPGDIVDDQAHIALLAALRVLGPDSPVQVPDAEGIMDALVTAAGPGALGDTLLKLRLSPAFAEPGTGSEPP